MLHWFLIFCSNCCKITAGNFSKSTMETQNNVWNLLKVNNKSIRVPFFQCQYCQFWPDFTHCSGVFIVSVEYVNASWEDNRKHYNKEKHQHGTAKFLLSSLFLMHGKTVKDAASCRRHGFWEMGNCGCSSVLSPESWKVSVFYVKLACNWRTLKCFLGRNMNNCQLRNWNNSWNSIENKTTEKWLKWEKSWDMCFSYFPSFLRGNG